MTNQIIHGDCIEKLKELPENSIDSIVTDPPYHLVSIVKRFGKESSAPAQHGKDGSFARLSGGFMGKTWDGLGEDGIGIANNPLMWAECLRVLKPGGYLLSFGGTRTYHRMASAIEDAGFEVRDMIEWVYGSGFPKSLNIGKAVDKLQGNEREVVGTTNSKGIRSGANNIVGDSYKCDGYDATKGTSEWEGWGTALKPAHEPICMARKPLAEKTVALNVLKYGTGGINIDESRVGMSQEDKEMLDAKASVNNNGVNFDVGEGKAKGTATPANNLGRFPANLIHDNSEEVRECFPETKSGWKNKDITKSLDAVVPFGAKIGYTGNHYEDDNGGNASRFFKSIIYQAKASKSERNKGCEELEQQITSDGREKSIDNAFQRGETLRHNNHPTVKPIALMEYLIKMVTQKGGIVLDPFAGSGSTLVAAKQNGYQYIGIEMTEEYIPIIKARLNND